MSDKDPNAWQRDPVFMATFLRKEADVEWAIDHAGEWERKYPGEHVIIWNKQIIDHGPDLEEVLQRASNDEHPREELAFFTVPGFLEMPPDDCGVPWPNSD